MAEMDDLTNQIAQLVQERKRKQDELMAPIGDGGSDTLKKAMVGFLSSWGAGLTGQDAGAATQRNLALMDEPRKQQFAARLKALDQYDDSIKNLVGLANVRRAQQKDNEAMKLNRDKLEWEKDSLPLKLQSQLNQKLETLSLMGFNAQQLQKIKQDGEMEIKRIADETARRGQDLTAETVRRGQDITSDTARRAQDTNAKIAKDKNATELQKAEMLSKQKQDAAKLKQNQLQVPGFTVIEGYSPTSKDVEEIKKVSTAGQSLKNTLGKLKSAVDQNGIEVLPGQNKRLMEGLVRDVQLQAKELYNLGVLNGPDLQLMESIISNPTSFWDVAKNLGQKDAFLKSFDQVGGLVDSRVGAVANGRGFVKSQSQNQSTIVPQEKFVGGARYIKVPGGWQKAQ